MRRPVALLPFLLPLIVACGGGPGVTHSSAAAEDGTDACTATFTWWQKDAYKSTAGRSTSLWPPHTTTELQVTCGDQTMADASMTNHGTALGAVDANGDVILQQVKQSDPVTGTRDDMTALVAAYQSCDCDSVTQFLSMNDARSGIIPQVLGNVTGYAKQHLECPGNPSTDDVVAMIQGGDYEGAVAAVQVCWWDDGTSFDDGLQQAASAVLAQTGDTLDGYHVCNNDAMLQAGLFSDFAAGNGVGQCDATSSVCAGPSFFYDP